MSPSRKNPDASRCGASSCPLTNGVIRLVTLQETFTTLGSSHTIRQAICDTQHTADNTRFATWEGQTKSILRLYGTLSRPCWTVGQPIPDADGRRKQSDTHYLVRILRVTITARNATFNCSMPASRVFKLHLIADSDPRQGAKMACLWCMW